MIASDELFKLIRSMSRTEKSYFKKFSALNIRKGQNKYILLFDAIEKQKEYDEAALRQQFRYQAFARQFPVAKSYLHERVLASLRVYHNSHSQTIRDHIQEAEILLGKGLYEQSLKQIRRAKKIAINLEFHNYLPEILQMERKIAFENHDWSFIKNITEEEQASMKMVENSRSFSELATYMGIFTATHGEGKALGHISELKNLMDNPLVQDESNAITFSSKVNFYYLHAFFWSMKEEHKKACDFFKKELQVFIDHPHMIRPNFHSYLSCLNNILAAITKHMDFSEYEFYLKMLKESAAMVKNHNLKARVFIWYTNFLLDHIMHMGQYERGPKLVPQILKEYAEYEDEMNQMEKTIIYLDIALVWFGNGEFKKSLHYLNKIRNEFSADMLQSLEYFLNIFYITVHYEAKHYDLLRHLTQAGYRSLERQQQPSRFDRTMLDFFSNVAETKDSSTEKFVTLKEEFKLLQQDVNEKPSFYWFDYVSWAESKIEGRLFADVVRRKALNP